MDGSGNARAVLTDATGRLVVTDVATETSTAATATSTATTAIATTATASNTAEIETSTAQTAAATASASTQGGQENSHVLKASAGRFLSLEVETAPTLATGIYFCDILDANAVPADGNISAYPVLGSFIINHAYGTPDTPSFAASDHGIQFNTGCIAYVGTTRPPTKTIVTGGPWCWFNGEVE